MKKHFYLLLLLLLCLCLSAACQPRTAPASAEPVVTAAPVVSTAAPTATPAPTPVPTATPAPTATPVPTPFTLLWISDTQAMAYANPEALTAMGAWISDRADDGDIAYVLQTGDAVENGFNAWQWANFDLCYDQFSDRVPFFQIAGNHEIDVRRHDYAGYLTRETVLSLPDEQKFEDGRAAYATFRAAGEDFLLLGAGWESELPSVDWLNEVLTQYPDHTAILLFHGFLDAGGRFTVIGKQMFPLLAPQNPNVRLILCGHVLGKCGSRTEVFDDDGDGAADRSVNVMMYNYQDADRDCGQLRSLTFDPVSRSITVTTYSPHTQRYYRDHSQHGKSTFVLENAF